MSMLAMCWCAAVVITADFIMINHLINQWLG